MRSFVIAALMTALVAALGYAIAPGVTEPAAPQLAASEAAGEEAAGNAVEGGEDENVAEPTGAGAPAATKSTFYQWTDERGSVRFARSLDEVPPAWRERAGQVEVDAAAFTKSNPARAQRAAAAVHAGFGLRGAFPVPRRDDLHRALVRLVPEDDRVARPARHRLHEQGHRGRRGARRRAREEVGLGVRFPSSRSMARRFADSTRTRWRRCWIESVRSQP